MSKDILQLIDEEILSDTENFVGPVEIVEIDSFEKKLDVTFSEEYITFIQKYGGAILESYLIYGTKAVYFMGVSLNTVLDFTLFYREQNWPGLENCYVISDDGSGNPIYMDPEGKVWLSDHDAGFETILLADSFNEFLIKIYEDRLYD